MFPTTAPSATAAATIATATEAATAAAAEDSTMATDSVTDHGTATDSRETSDLPLHGNNQHIDLAKVRCFACKFNEFRRKQRGSRVAIRQAESRATKTTVSAMMDAGDDDQQRAPALHEALIDPWRSMMSNSSMTRKSMVVGGR